jgi:sarcosine oxidase, subunit delta
MSMALLASRINDGEENSKMLLITCPHCGPREETEFTCGGEAHVARPLAENTLNDTEFAEYLFLRDNPKGVFLERWRHASGCRRWFNMARDTISHAIIEIYPMGALPESASGKAAHKDSWRRATPAEAAAMPTAKAAKPVRKGNSKTGNSEKNGVGTRQKKKD